MSLLKLPDSFIEASVCPPKIVAHDVLTDEGNPHYEYVEQYMFNTDKAMEEWKHLDIKARNKFNDNFLFFAESNLYAFLEKT